MDLVHDFYLAKRPPKSKMSELKEQLIEKVNKSNRVTQEMIDITTLELDAYRAMRTLTSKQLLHVKDIGYGGDIYQLDPGLVNTVSMNDIDASLTKSKKKLQKLKLMHALLRDRLPSLPKKEEVRDKQDQLRVLTGDID